MKFFEYALKEFVASWVDTPANNLSALLAFFAKTFLNFYIISEYDELVAAQVEVFDRELGSTYKQLTTDQGEFKMRFHPGFFDVKITHINYHDIYIKNIELKAGQFRFLKLMTNALKD
jgi:hypothetical protein